MTYLKRRPELFIYLFALIFYSPFCSFPLEGSTVGGALNGLKRLEGFQVSREGESQRRDVNNRSEKEEKRGERVLGDMKGERC